MHNVNMETFAKEQIEKSEKAMSNNESFFIKKIGGLKFTSPHKQSPEQTEALETCKASFYPQLPIGVTTIKEVAAILKSLKRTSSDKLAETLLTIDQK